MLLKSRIIIIFIRYVANADKVWVQILLKKKSIHLADDIYFNLTSQPNGFFSTSQVSLISKGLGLCLIYC